MKILINLTLFLLGCGLLIWAINSVDTEKALKFLFELGFGFYAFFLIYSFIIWLDTLIMGKRFPNWNNHSFFESTIMGNPLNWKSLKHLTPLRTFVREPVKAHLLKEHCDISIKQSLASLIIAKTIFLTALIIFCIPGIYFIFDSAKIPENFKTISPLGMKVFSLLIFLFFIF